MRPLSIRLRAYPLARGLHAIARLPRRLLCMAVLARQRRALAQMEPYLLDDMGMTGEAARREAARRPWDAPDHWHD